MPTIGPAEFTFENAMVDSRMCRKSMAPTQNHRRYGITSQTIESKPENLYNTTSTPATVGCNQQMQDNSIYLPLF